jgi:alanyl-tRNA synthetase
MLGNFSFGGPAPNGVEGYFKKEAITYAFDFIVKELKLEIDYVTVFEGNEHVPFDKDSYEIWKDLGIAEEKIKKFGMADNFWGPTGNGGPCGPTTEIYVNGIEIWNIVFNEFFCDDSREQLLEGHAQLTPLDIKGIDTGMGLERLVMVVQKVPTVFETDLFESTIKLIPKDINIRKKRVFADHARAIVFLISDGVVPSNKNQGYILRRLIRRVLAEEFLAKKYFFEELLAKPFTN